MNEEAPKQLNLKLLEEIRNDLYNLEQEKIKLQKRIGEIEEQESALRQKENETRGSVFGKTAEIGV